MNITQKCVVHDPTFVHLSVINEDASQEYENVGLYCDTLYLKGC